MDAPITVVGRPNYYDRFDKLGTIVLKKCLRLGFKGSSVIKSQLSTFWYF